MEIIFIILTIFFMKVFNEIDNSLEIIAKEIKRKNDYDELNRKAKING